jgi:hypothetical protein
MNTSTQNPVTTSELPPVGQPLADGTFAGLTTTREGIHCALVLLTTADKRMEWSAATAWAASVGGSLPTRPQAAQLYALLKSRFESTWYWTSETLDADTGDKADASYAWYQDFGYGGQYDTHKSAQGAAVAVRLIPLST